MIIRKAEEKDLQTITEIYEEIHTAEESGQATIGWIRGVYPTEETAWKALERDDLFVAEADGGIVGVAIINQQQVEVYEGAAWRYMVPDAEVMVLHTLVISPRVAGKGYGKAFAKYYEEYALANGCHYLRIDTNARNVRARAMYKQLGYEEIAIVPCEFNGIPGVQLVLLEKALGGTDI